MRQQATRFVLWLYKGPKAFDAFFCGKCFSSSGWRSDWIGPDPEKRVMCEASLFITFRDLLLAGAE